MDYHKGLGTSLRIGKRVAEEHVCGRCEQFVFRIIPEREPTKCPRCETIACSDCYWEFSFSKSMKSSSVVMAQIHISHSFL